MAGDYRVFVGAFPQGALADRSQALRLDTSAHRCPAGRAAIR